MSSWRREESFVVEPAAASPSLRENSVGTGGSWILSVADVAPSASVAFTLGLLVATAGLASPLVVIVVGIAMFLVATGYSHLNRWRPATGAPFLWIMGAVSPIAGLIMGLLMIIASLFSNIANITLAGGYLLSIVSPTTTYPWWAVWLVATALMAVLTVVAIVGLRPSVRLQLALMVFEYAAVLAFAVLAVVYELTTHIHGVTGPTWRALTTAGSPTGFHGLVLAVVPCAFLFAGWEAPFYLGEESRNRAVSPGAAARVGVAFVLVLFVILILFFQGVAPTKTLVAHGSDVLTFAGGVLAGSGWGRVLSVAVLVSVLAVTQTLLIVGSRLVVGAVRESLLPGVLGRISASYRTPHVATAVLAAIPVVILIPYLLSTSVANRVGEIVSAGGLLYLFVYFAVAATSAWFGLARSGGDGRPRSDAVTIAASVIGGLFMIATFAYGLTTQTTFVSASAGAVIVLSVLGGVAAYVLRRRAQGRVRSRAAGSGVA